MAGGVCRKELECGGVGSCRGRVSILKGERRDNTKRSWRLFNGWSLLQVGEVLYSIGLFQGLQEVVRLCSEKVGQVPLGKRANTSRMINASSM